MKSILRRTAISLVAATVMSAVTAAASAAEIKAKLTGAQEVPPVETMATGAAAFVVNDDMSISGSVKTTGVKGIAAHIHEGNAATNGPVAVPLTQKGDNEWTVPDGAKLTAAQMDALKAGNLYVNVHSDAHKGGEIRAQLKK